jgi:hypothetical protein
MLVNLPTSGEVGEEREEGEGTEGFPPTLESETPTMGSIQKGGDRLRPGDQRAPAAALRQCRGPGRVPARLESHLRP